MGPMTSFSPSQTSQNISHPNVGQTHAVAPMEGSMTHYDEQYDDYGQYEDQSYGVGIDSSMTTGEGNKDFTLGVGGDGDIQSPEDLNKFVVTDSETKLRICGICNYSNKAAANVRYHIE